MGKGRAAFSHAVFFFLCRNVIRTCLLASAKGDGKSGKDAPSGSILCRSGVSYMVGRVDWLGVALCVE